MSDPIIHSPVDRNRTTSCDLKCNDDGGGVWNKITRRKPSGANNQFAHGMQPNRMKPVRGRGDISTPSACTGRSDISKNIPNNKYTNFSSRCSNAFHPAPQPARPISGPDQDSRFGGRCRGRRKGIAHRGPFLAKMTAHERHRSIDAFLMDSSMSGLRSLWYGGDNKSTAH
jgi:hypothetical protein